jgi:O-antigen ligase
LPTLAIGLAIPLSVSRSAVLVIGAAFIVLLIGWPSKFRRRFLMLAPVIIVAARVALPGVVGTIIALFTNLGNDPSVSGRTGDYDVIFNVASDNPVFGRGLFTFVPRYYRILDNQLATTLLELGIVGLLAVFGLFLTAYACARAARRRAVEAEHRHLGLVTSASIAGVLLSYATFDTWSFPMAAGVTFLVIGLSGAIWQASFAETTQAVPADADGGGPTSGPPERHGVAAPALHAEQPALRSRRASA